MIRLHYLTEVKGFCRYGRSLINWVWTNQKGDYLGGPDLIRKALKRGFTSQKQEVKETGFYWPQRRTKLPCCERAHDWEKSRCWVWPQAKSQQEHRDLSLTTKTEFCEWPEWGWRGPWASGVVAALLTLWFRSGETLSSGPW